MYCLGKVLPLDFSDRRLFNTSSSRIKMEFCVVIILDLVGIVFRNKRIRRGLLLLHPVNCFNYYWVRESSNYSLKPSRQSCHFSWGDHALSITSMLQALCLTVVPGRVPADSHFFIFHISFTLYYAIPVVWFHLNLPFNCHISFFYNMSCSDRIR